jgi:hypothetical protein
LVADFTGPGAAIERGDGKNPAPPPDQDSERINFTLRGFVALLTPSSFGLRFGRKKQ